MFNYLPFDIQNIIFSLLPTKQKRMIYYIIRHPEFREQLALIPIHGFFFPGYKITPNDIYSDIIYNCINNIYRTQLLCIQTVIKRLPITSLRLSLYRQLYITNNHLSFNNKLNVIRFINYLYVPSIFTDIEILNNTFNQKTDIVTYIRAYYIDRDFIPYTTIKPIINRLTKHNLIGLLPNFGISID